MATKDDQILQQSGRVTIWNNKSPDTVLSSNNENHRVVQLLARLRKINVALHAKRYKNKKSCYN